MGPRLGYFFLMSEPIFNSIATELLQLNKSE